MQHWYPCIILSLCLTAAFFLGGCTQNPQLPDAAQNDAEILSETASPSAPPTASPSLVPSEAKPRDSLGGLLKPEGNARESEEARRKLYERAATLYQDEFDYLDQNGFSYTFVDIGAQYPVMLTADETFTYKSAESLQTCMQCDIYYLKGNEVHILGSLSSLGTAYPIAFDETGLYEAGPRGVREWTIRTEEGSPELVMAQDAYVSYDENGNPFYSCEKYGEPLEISESDYHQLFGKYQSASAVHFEKSPACSIPAEALALMQYLEDASGHKMEEYIYVDMDHDGKEEMVGTYEEDFCNWPVWYASSDGRICQPVPGLLQGYDTCTFQPLSFPSETHIVVNMVNLMGNNKRYSIYRLNGQEMQPLAENQYGFVYQNVTGDILLDVEDYDAHYDIASELFMGHTWKDTYLYCEDGIYKEYGAIILSETQFLQYDNAAEFLSDIRNEVDGDMQFSFFLRENGIVHIQCECTTEYGSVDYFYYTLRVEGNHLAGSLESKNDGRMGTSFSLLEVTYPKGLSTDCAKSIAWKKDEYMRGFLRELNDEWNG